MWVAVLAPKVYHWVHVAVGKDDDLAAQVPTSIALLWQFNLLVGNE